MKNCPTCSRTYPDSFSFCVEDGKPLSAPYDPDATLIIQHAEPNESASKLRIDDSVVAINISQQYPHVRGEEDLYSVTRGMWRVDRLRAGKAKYAFAVYQGLIKEVYEINKWVPSGEESLAYWVARFKSQGRELPPMANVGRSEFNGRLAPAEVRSKYVGRRFPERMGQNPIRYMNC